MPTTKKINANGTEISILLQGNENDYICLTDMARYKDKQRTDYIIQNWLRSRSTIEYLGVWEQLHNPNFNPIEFDGFRKNLNMRDTASINELVVLSNMESLNSELIKQGMSRDVRYEVLHRMAEEQLKVLNDQNAEYRFKKLTSGTEIIND
jgi:hypothetical protein